MELKRKEKREIEEIATCLGPFQEQREDRGQYSKGITERVN